MITPGKRSWIKALKRGKSSAKNLGRLASLIALMSKTSSAKSGLDLFNYPAITKTDFTALRPKS